MFLNNKKYYFGWDGSSEVVGFSLNKTFQNEFNKIKEIQINSVLNVKYALQVFIEPKVTDDWEIVNLHCGYLENQLLNQINVMAIGQNFSFWINNQQIVNFVTGFLINKSQNRTNS